MNLREMKEITDEDNYNVKNTTDIETISLYIDEWCGKQICLYLEAGIKEHFAR